MLHTVLLVDDDANLLEALERQLYGQPYTVITAQSGEEAMEILGRTVVDVVVSDQQMPGLKGSQFLWKVKNAFPDIILFMLTGQAAPRLAELAVKDLGISRYFTKPCNATDLATSIHQSLKHRDLFVLSKQLLQKVRRQDAILEGIGQESPELVQAESSKGADVLIEDNIPEDEDAFIKELRAMFCEEG